MPSSRLVKLAVSLAVAMHVCACSRTTDHAPAPGPRPDPTGGLGAASFASGELDAASHGGTITFEQIGASGWYPSRRDPATGPCDAYQGNGCCLARRNVTSDALTPWDQDLVLTLRGPLRMKQMAVYQPDPSGTSDAWDLVSRFDARAPADASGVAFHGNGAESAFGGEVGTECLVDVSTNLDFPCGSSSSPFCPANASERSYGWSGSKLFVLLATMPHASDQVVGTPCSTNDQGNWYDAPWLGLSLGELARAGAFSTCQCYAKDASQWWLADGCGQFNVFEVVNDNNAYRNLDVFSTNFFGYGGYVGEGPCGSACNVASLSNTVDLIDKANDVEAPAGAVASPTHGPGVAFRRPAHGYRYFVILLHVPTRTVQLAVIHPGAIPTSLSGFLPALPSSVPSATVSSMLALRLPL